MVMVGPQRCTGPLEVPLEQRGAEAAAVARSARAICERLWTDDMMRRPSQDMSQEKMLALGPVNVAFGCAVVKSPKVSHKRTRLSSPPLG